MPTISIFIRNEDLPKWKALENKSQWLHDHLQVDVRTDTVDTDLGKVTYPVVETLKPRPMAEVLAEEDEFSYLENWIYSPVDGAVFDTETQQPVDGVTKKDVDELKRRGQVA